VRINVSNQFLTCCRSLSCYNLVTFFANSALFAWVHCLMTGGTSACGACRMSIATSPILKHRFHHHSHLDDTSDNGTRVTVFVSGGVAQKYCVCAGTPADFEGGDATGKTGCKVIPPSAKPIRPII
jgi:hypothetical protein